MDQQLISHTATHLLSHWKDVLTGALTWSIIGHIVNTAPAPQNKWGQWILGSIQFAVGQRIAADNTVKGLQTESKGVYTPPTSEK